MRTRISKNHHTGSGHYVSFWPEQWSDHLVLEKLKADADRSGVKHFDFSGDWDAEQWGSGTSFHFDQCSPPSSSKP